MIKEFDPKNITISFGGKPVVPCDQVSITMLKAEADTQGDSCVVIGMTPQPEIGVINPVSPMTMEDVLAIERDVIATLGIWCPFPKGSKIGVSDDGWVISGHGRTDVGKFHDFVVTEANAIKFNGKWCWEVRYE